MTINKSTLPHFLLSKLCFYQKRVDQFITSELTHLANRNSDDYNLLLEVMAYALEAGGKRIRPFLVYVTGQMFNVPISTLDVPAAAIEAMHTYSLIHDDLPAMDNDSLRRGHLTCHLKFGEAEAILAGDALQSLAFSLLADKPMPNITPATRIALISELANASGVLGMCGGQALDISTTQQQGTLQQLEIIHRKKTGALIKAAMRLGALTANVCQHTIMPLLDRYADAIGLAFQVQDDILNVTGNPEKLGKDAGTDASLGKNTYPALMGKEGAQQRLIQLCNEALQALSVLTKQGYYTILLEQMAYFIVQRDR